MKKSEKRLFTISGCLVFMLLMTFILIGPALAEPKHWIGNSLRDSSTWNDPLNWDPNGVPQKGDAVTIDTAGDEVSYNNPLNPTLLSVVLDDPHQNLDPPRHPTLNQDALILTTEKTVIGLSKGFSFFNQTGGTHRTLIGSLHNNPDPEKGNLNLGVGAGSSGYYDLVDAVLLVAGHEKVGIEGMGQMNQMGGSNLRNTGPTLQCETPVNPPPVTPPPVEPVHTIGKNLYLGLLKGSDGQFNIEAGRLTVGGSIRVGNFGTGMFDHRNSKVTIKANDPEPLENNLQTSGGGDFFNVRRKQSSAPSLEWGCNNHIKHPGLIIGRNNQGIYNLEAGTLTVNNSEIIGWGPGSRFFDTGNGSGYSSFFTQDHGTHKVNGNFIVAKHDDLTDYPVLPFPVDSYPNYYSLNGTSIYEPNAPADSEKGLLDVGGYASVGYLGYGAIYQDGGTIKVRGVDQELINIGLRTASSPETPSLQCNTTQRHYIGLTVGRSGVGEYYLSNGEVLVSRGEAIGVFKGSKGTFVHNSGSHYVGGILTLALLPDSKGFYEFYDGLLAARGGLVNNGDFKMYGGVLQAKVTNNGLFLVGKPETGKPAPSIIGDFFNKEKATLTLEDTAVKFGTNFYNSGIINSANKSLISTPTFKNLTINESGGLDLTIDEITVTGNLTNKSTKPDLWKTKLALLAFNGPGTHTFKTGNDSSGDWSKNFGWGVLDIVNGAVLRLQGHLYASEIRVKAEGGKITNMFGFCGIKVFYDPDFSDIEGLKLLTPWGKEVGTLQGGVLVPSCQ